MLYLTLLDKMIISFNFVCFRYLKYLYPYECSMHNFSTPKELQAAIDSNRRDRFSTLYHTEPSMAANARDERFVNFSMNSMEYATLPNNRHHMPHHVIPSSHTDIRYMLKRPGEPITGKQYDKYGAESPKVIILQDGTQASDRNAKVSPPYHSRPRSPLSLRESELRGLAEMEAARRRGHHGIYGTGKEWDGDARQGFEDERRRLLDDIRPRGAVICKDKNCNGVSHRLYNDHTYFGLIDEHNSCNGALFKDINICYSFTKN